MQEEVNKNRGIDRNYLAWLYQIVDEKDYPNYWGLLNTLYNFAFVSVNIRDQARESEGFNLRENFIDEGGHLYLEGTINDFYSKPISVLEVLVALAIKCDEQVMGDLTKGNRAADWFWRMIKNLGIFGYSDEVYSSEYADYVNDILENFVSRTYDYDGKGGLFPLKNPPGDERKTEIWYQMMAYLDENFPI
jgi:hypothetical protein